MPSPKTHVNDSLQAIDAHTWLLGDRLLLSHQPTPAQPPQGHHHHHHASWADGTGGVFTLSDAPTPLPALHPHPSHSAILPRVYTAGDQSAVWRASDAFIKARDRRLPRLTPEHATLAFVASQTDPRLRDCRLPAVLCHAMASGREGTTWWFPACRG